MELELTLQTEAPLALRASRTSEQFTPTLTHIPGTTLRGALAMEYLRAGGAPTDGDFQALFLSEAVSVGPLFPSTETHAGRPLSASAVACKRFGAKHPASVGDTLLRLELARITQSLDPLDDWLYCPDCRREYPDRPPNTRDRLRGYYLYGRDFHRIEPSTRMLTGVGMSRATGTAAHRLLFSMEALEEGQWFRGRIRVRGDAAERLADRLRALAPADSDLRLGAARSRGRGRLKVIGWRQVEPKGPPLVDRWEALNTTIRNLWADYGVEPEGEYFTLTMESPLVLRDGCLRPLHPDQLDAKALSLPDKVERQHVLLREVTLQGWNAAWRLPKGDTPAIGAGAVLLFRTPADMREDVLARLAEMQAAGLGERRNEGLGRVRVCDPLHYSFEEATR